MPSISDASARDALFEAAFWHGSIGAANAVLTMHPELEGADIHVAALLGDEVAVRRFLDEDRQLVSATSGPRGVDPLTWLCFSAYLQTDASRSDGFLGAATALLDAGADPNTGFFDETHRPHPERESVLYGAAGVAHHAGVTKLLLERGADPNDEEVPYHAPETYDNGAVQALLGSGRMSADSLTMMLLRKADWHDLDGVRLLLDHGADPNQMSRFGKTALHQAVGRDNRLEIIDLLLDRGADPRIVASEVRHGDYHREGRSGMAIAAWRGRADVLASVERRGIPLSLDGADRLAAACARNDAVEAKRLAAEEPESLRRLLVEGGAVLAEFAGNDNAAGVSLLIDLGVPVDALYAGDQYYGVAARSTALHVAGWRAAHDTVDMLIARGGNVNARDGLSRTPLMRAVSACVDSYWAWRRSPRSVEALLSAGAVRDGIAQPCGYAEADALLSAM